MLKEDCYACMNGNFIEDGLLVGVLLRIHLHKTGAADYYYLVVKRSFIHAASMQFISDCTSCRII